MISPYLLIIVTPTHMMTAAMIHAMTKTKTNQIPEKRDHLLHSTLFIIYICLSAMFLKL